MTIPPHQRNRARNFRIVGTIRNATEILNLDWQPLDSKLLAAVAYVARRRLLYLRFQSGELYRHFTFSAELDPRAVTSSTTSGITSPTNVSVGSKLLLTQVKTVSTGRLPKDLTTSGASKRSNSWTLRGLGAEDSSAKEAAKRTQNSRSRQLQFVVRKCTSGQTA
jgi:hypothetical protein